MCFGSDAPKPPDPNVVAAAQTKLNLATAEAQGKQNKELAAEQARLAMTGQTSDFGSISYVKDPSSPSGYRAVQTLSPEDQALLGQQRDLRANLGDVTNASLNNVSQMISGGPFDLTAARGREISDIQQTFLDPQWESQRKAIENQLINKGVRPGSEQYETAMRQFGQQRSDSYNKMFLDAFNTANSAALTERNLPMEDYARLMGFNSPVNPNQPTVGTPAPGVAGVNIAPTDIVGPTYASYNANAANAANSQSGLYGLLGTVGSAAMQYGPGLIAASDRRVKRDIKRVGVAPNGLNLYEFRYIGRDETLHRGFMADEVRELHPDAVITIGGIDHVDYSKAVL